MESRNVMKVAVRRSKFFFLNFTKDEIDINTNKRINGMVKSSANTPTIVTFKSTTERTINELKYRKAATLPYNKTLFETSLFIASCGISMLFLFADTVIYFPFSQLHRFITTLQI